MKRWFFRLAARLGYTCRQTSEHYTLLEEGALSEEQARQMKRHLRVCSACKAYRAQMQAVSATLRATAPEPLPEGERERLARLFREKRAKG